MFDRELRYVLIVGVAVGVTVGPLAVTAHDAQASDWVKSPYNPMLSLGEGDAFDSHDIFSPAVAKHEGTYYLYYSGGPNPEHTMHQLGLALSDDGVQWEKTGQPLLALGERDNFHATPALLRNEEGNLLLGGDGLWHMVYVGNRADDVEHATSSDGVHWEKDPLSPIYQNAYAPNLMQVGDELRMYYIHKPSGRPWEVHLATGNDIYSLQPHEANPVLTLSQSWESTNLVYPYVLREESTWVMYYAAYWSNPPEGGAHTAIGSATSTDGIQWAKNPGNPVLTPTPGSSYDSQYTSSEAVIRDGDEYKMYYAGRIDMIHKYYSIGLATKPVPGDPPPGPLPAYTAAILADGPIAYWQFEDGDFGDVLNGAAARDSVGAGPGGDHPGTYTVEGSNDGVQLVAGVPEIGGKAAHFIKAGSGEYILFDTLGDFGSHIDDNGATFEFWIKNRQQDTTNNRVFGVWNERPDGDRKTQLSFTLHRPTDKQELFLRDDTDAVQEAEFDDSLVDINDGQWHHVAWVIEPGVPAGGMTLYVDGLELNLDFVTTNTQADFADFDKGFIVGGEHAAGFNPQNFVINAMIDEFAIYGKALTLAQIQHHLDAMAVIPGDANYDGKVTDADAAILAAHWQMQSGATWADGDFDGDGKVTDADAAILVTHWQEGVEGSTPVPEPGMFVLLVGGCLWLFLEYWKARA